MLNFRTSFFLGVIFIMLLNSCNNDEINNLQNTVFSLDERVSSLELQVEKLKKLVDQINSMEKLIKNLDILRENHAKELENFSKKIKDIENEVVESKENVVLLEGKLKTLNEQLNIFMKQNKIYEGALVVDSSTSDSELQSFFEEGYEVILGGLKIDNPKIKDLKYLKKLTTVGNFLSITNTSFQNLEGLESLAVIVGDFLIMDNEHLSNLKGLNALNKVLGRIVISLNKSLISLEGLENLVLVKSTTLYDDSDSQMFAIDGNVKLSSFCALTNLFKNNGFDLDVGGVDSYYVEGNLFNPSYNNLKDEVCSK